MRCKYTLSKHKAPYPRVAYDCECGFYFVKMEGYKWLNTTSCGGDPFSVRTSELDVPAGVCMKCKKEIEYNPTSEEVGDE